MSDTDVKDVEAIEEGAAETVEEVSSDSAVEEAVEKEQETASAEKEEGAKAAEAKAEKPPKAKKTAKEDAKPKEIKRPIKGQEYIDGLEKKNSKENAPYFNVGDTVKVHARITEGTRSRIQVFEGIVLKIQGGGNRTTFTVRKSTAGIGVERTWPLHSPSIEAVEVVRRGKVRRAKLFYLRKLSGKKAKVKELIK